MLENAAGNPPRTNPGTSGRGAEDDDSVTIVIDDTSDDGSDREGDDRGLVNVGRESNDGPDSTRSDSLPVDFGDVFGDDENDKLPVGDADEHELGVSAISGDYGELDVDLSPWAPLLGMLDSTEPEASPGDRPFTPAEGVEGAHALELRAESMLQYAERGAQRTGELDRIEVGTSDDNRDVVAGRDRGRDRRDARRAHGPRPRARRRRCGDERRGAAHHARAPRGQHHHGRGDARRVRGRHLRHRGDERRHGGGRRASLHRAARRVGARPRGHGGAPGYVRRRRHPARARRHALRARVRPERACGTGRPALGHRGLDDEDGVSPADEGCHRGAQPHPGRWRWRGQCERLATRRTSGPRGGRCERGHPDRGGKRGCARARRRRRRRHRRDRLGRPHRGERVRHHRGRGPAAPREHRRQPGRSGQGRRRGDGIPAGRGDLRAADPGLGSARARRRPRSRHGRGGQRSRAAALSDRARGRRVRLRPGLRLAPRPQPVLPRGLELARQHLHARVLERARRAGGRAAHESRRLDRRDCRRQLRPPYREHLRHHADDARGGGADRQTRRRGRYPYRDGPARGAREHHDRRRRGPVRRVLRRGGRVAARAHRCRHRHGQAEELARRAVAAGAGHVRRGRAARRSGRQGEGRAGCELGGGLLGPVDQGARRGHQPPRRLERADRPHPRGKGRSLPRAVRRRHRRRRTVRLYLHPPPHGGPGTARSLHQAPGTTRRDALRSGVLQERRRDGWRHRHGGGTPPHGSGARPARTRLGAFAWWRGGRARRRPRSRRRRTDAAPARRYGRRSASRRGLGRSGRRHHTPRARPALFHPARDRWVRLRGRLRLAPDAEPVLPRGVPVPRQLLHARVPQGDRCGCVEAVQ